MLVLQYVGNQFIGELCNGSTTDSDSVCEGSNPSSPAKTKRYSFECRFVLTLVKLRKKDLNKALRKPFGEGFLALTEGFCKAYISNTAFLPCKIREQYPSSPAKPNNLENAYKIKHLQGCSIFLSLRFNPYYTAFLHKFRCQIVAKKCVSFQS